MIASTEVRRSDLIQFELKRFLGTVKGIVNGTCQCRCVGKYHGAHCELQVDLCQNFTCENQGVCVSRADHAACLCVGSGFYSGDRCEIVETKRIVLGVVAKSFSWLAILILICFALFIIIMDLLKYVFGIDPVEVERKKMREERRRRRRPVVQHFVYVNAPDT